jgi:glutamyl-tRNA reductase
MDDSTDYLCPFLNKPNKRSLDEMSRPQIRHAYVLTLLPPTVITEIDEEDSEAVRRAIHCHGEELKQQELEQAFSQLTVRGDLTQRQQEIIADMASAIVEDILAAPDSMLENVSIYDEDTVQTAIELFNPDE